MSHDIYHLTGHGAVHEVLKLTGLATKVYDFSVTCALRVNKCHFSVYTVILLPAHPASFAHKFLFQRVPASPGMQ